MKPIYLLLFLMMVTLTVKAQNKMDNTYFTWDDFVEGFGKEMVSAEDVYGNMVDNGLKDNALLPVDFTFISDSKENLEALSTFITEHYPYKIQGIKQFEDIWELNGVTNELPVTSDNLLYWMLDMYKRGYEFDAYLDAYGAFNDAKNQHFPDLDKKQESVYFDKGLECYNEGNLSGAIINWSLALTINPQEVDAYYSRAIAKEELYIWKAALADYDKALEIAPDFISALLNRGALKDEHDDYKGAIEDYDKALQTGKADEEEEQLIYFNRGNSKYNLKDLTGACEDWKTAYKLGADYAKEKLDKYCK